MTTAELQHSIDTLKEFPETIFFNQKETTALENAITAMESIIDGTTALVVKDEEE